MIWMNKQLLVYQPVDEDTQTKAQQFVGTILHEGANQRG